MVEKGAGAALGVADEEDGAVCDPDLCVDAGDDL